MVDLTREMAADRKHNYTHKELVALGVRYLYRKCGGIVFYEFQSRAGENPDVIGWRSGRSILIECKISRADFLRDRHKPVRRVPEIGMGAERYYLCPEGMVKPDELPTGWGLLHALPDKRYPTAVIARKSDFFADRNHHAEIQFLCSMLRRAQIRIGVRPLSEWLRMENITHRGLERLGQEGLFKPSTS